MSKSSKGREALRDAERKLGYLSSHGEGISVATDTDQQRWAVERKVEIMAGINGVADVAIATICSLMKACHATSSANGFWEGEQNFGEKLALVHSEISEALEADRNGVMADDKIQAFTGVEAELADAVIRIFDTAAGYDIDLAGALIAKMKYNLSRPRKHGKKY